jgi:DNA-directed RNA polymerase specialized sigma24 family protein
MTSPKWPEELLVEPTQNAGWPTTAIISTGMLSCAFGILLHKFIDHGWNHDLGPSEWKAEAGVLEIFADRVSKLPAREADAFMLHEIEAMKTAQICQALRISQNNMWVMLHPVRMPLRECLEVSWFENKPKLRTDE